MKYKHISQKEREEIYVFNQEGYSKNEIAKELGRDRSTIGRELKRNATSIERRFNNSPKKRKHYLPDRAQIKYETRRKKAKTAYPLKNPFIYTYTIDHLKRGWAPEIISGKIKQDHGQRISPECIYQYIYSKHAKEKRLWEYLPQGHRKRRKKTGRKTRRSLIPNRIDISARPLEVETRERIGDWEGDTIFGKGKGAALATFNERKNKIIRIRKLKKKTAKAMEKAAMDVFAPLPKPMRLTLTLDNGAENSRHEKIKAKTGMDIYFARPYHSWERGSNERGNGLIRRYFPKGTNFDHISDEAIAWVENQINSRPMKCLQWKTPNEVYQEHLTQLLSNHSPSVALEI